MTPNLFSGFSLDDYARLSQWLYSKPAIVISYFKRCGIHSLLELELVNRLQKSNPRQYTLLVAEARAQGLPIN